MSTAKLEAKKRLIQGSKVKQLRREGILPTNIHGKSIDSVAIQVKQTDFEKVYNEVGETGLVEISLEGDKEARTVMISEVQYDPITDQLVHADLHQVDLTETVTANVPLEFVGEAPAVKSAGAGILTTLEEIEVEALPTKIPDHLEVDLSSLEKVGDTITVADIKVPAEVTVKTDLSNSVVVAQEKKVVAEPEETTEEEVETETSSDDKSETEE